MLCQKESFKLRSILNLLGLKQVRINILKALFRYQKTRVIRLAKEVKLLIKKVKQSKVVQKLKHLVRGKMKRAIKGENWIPIPETRLNAIVEKLSPQVQEEMKEKLQEFNAMLHDLDDKKQEIHRLETNCLKTEVEFSEAMDMVVATSKGKSIPHKKGLVVAFPASRDGQQRSIIS